MNSVASFFGDMFEKPLRLRGHYFSDSTLFWNVYVRNVFHSWRGADLRSSSQNPCQWVQNPWRIDLEILLHLAVAEFQRCFAEAFASGQLHAAS